MAMAPSQSAGGTVLPSSAQPSRPAHLQPILSATLPTTTRLPTDTLEAEPSHAVAVQLTPDVCEPPSPLPVLLDSVPQVGPTTRGVLLSHTCATHTHTHTQAG